MPSSPNRRAINAILAACEALLQEGRKPSTQQHKDLVACVRAGDNPAWDAFPLTRDWFCQL